MERKQVLNKSLTYVALLRGINVGGNKKVPMAELKNLMEKARFKNVKTVLASGNVVFTSSIPNIDQLKQTLTAALEKQFSFTIPFIVIPFNAIENIIKSDPFKKIIITPETRLYVSFLSEKTKSILPLPFNSQDNSFLILSKTDHAVFSVLDLSKTQTTDLMKVLEKEFGKNITTRNWNTVEKIAGLKI